MISPPQPYTPPEQWLYLRDGKRFGPTDFEGLQAMADALHLRQDCKVARIGSQDAQLASDLPGLLFPAEPPPLPAAAQLLTGFYRSADEKLLLGLCGGIAHRLGVPVILVRTILVILAPIAFAYPLCVFMQAHPTRGFPNP
jgi:phage shock protein PspC (stress-responsive transcriptional regulator)